LIATISLFPKFHLAGDSFTDFQFQVIKVLNDSAVVDEPAESIRTLTIRIMKMIPDEVGMIGLALLDQCIGIEVCDGHGIGVKSP